MLNEFDLERYHILLGELEDLNLRAQHVNFQILKQALGESFKIFPKEELNSQISQIFGDRMHIYHKLEFEAEKLHIAPKCVTHQFTYINDSFAERLIKKYHVNSLPFMVENYSNLTVTLAKKLRSFGKSFNNGDNSDLKDLLLSFLDKNGSEFLAFAKLAGLDAISCHDNVLSLSSDILSHIDLDCLQTLKLFLISTLSISTLYNSSQRIKIIRIIAIINDMIMMKEIIDKESNKVRAVYDVITLNSILKGDQQILSRQLK